MRFSRRHRSHCSLAACQLVRYLLYVGLFLVGVSKVWAAPTSQPVKQPKNPSKSQSTSPPTTLSPRRLEWGAIGGPAINVDTGLEIAGFVHIARFKPGYSPYFWRLRFTFKFSMRLTPGGIEFPVHDYNAQVDFPGLVGGRLRLQAQVGFQKSISQYYGLGNASDGTRHWLQFDPDTQKDRYLQELRRYQYGITSPYGWISLQWLMARGWSLFGSLMLDYFGVEPYENSKLSADIRESRRFGNPRDNPYRSLLFGTTAHGLLRLQMGILWDTRDNEFAPSRGWYHDLSVRGAPGALLGLQYLFLGVNLSLRFYFPLWRDILVLAVRGVGDVLWGRVPFHLLTVTGGISEVDSFGGGSSIRGVRAQRYHGKAKVFGNLELRARIVQFIVRGTYFSVGLTAFFDAGRVWLDYGAFSALDGPGVGIHIGTGGGLRVQWGKSLIIRFDLAWSPDANPIGFYFNLGHLF